MKHYICTGGCGGVSEKPGICTAEVCSKKGQPLTECDCEERQEHDRVLPDVPDVPDSD